MTNVGNKSLIDETCYIEEHVSINESIIGPNTWIRRGSEIFSSEIGEGTFIGFRSNLANVVIEKRCQIASLVRIGDPLGSTVHIEEAVWIGARAVIHPGVRIGRGAVIAACAEVTGDVPPDHVAIGRPHRVLRSRDVIEDGSPNIENILRIVRARKVERPVIPSSWMVSPTTFLDVQFTGGSGVRLSDGVIAMGRPSGPSIYGGIRLGADISIGEKSILEGAGGIEIGSGTEIGADTIVLSSGHDLSRRSLPWVGAPVSIGTSVVIQAGSTIIGPCNIEADVTVMAGAVVRGNIREGSTEFGIFGRKGA
jgi:2,3,4,5-tetrahydropyridine-2-carboxylate N-succinyltransferase